MWCGEVVGLYNPIWKVRSEKRKVPSHYKFRKVPELLPNRKVRIVHIEYNYAAKLCDDGEEDDNDDDLGLPPHVTVVHPANRMTASAEKWKYPICDVCFMSWPVSWPVSWPMSWGVWCMWCIGMLSVVMLSIAMFIILTSLFCYLTTESHSTTASVIKHAKCNFKKCSITSKVSKRLTSRRSASILRIWHAGYPARQKATINTAGLVCGKRGVPGTFEVKSS